MTAEEKLKRLKYHRKIHIYKTWWLVSLYSYRGFNGTFEFNLFNILHYPLTFLFIPVRIE